MTEIGEFLINEKLDVIRGITSYRAENSKTKQKVILKMANNRLANSLETDYLIREFEVISTFSCANAPKYYDLKEENGLSYLVIEDFGGVTLRKLIEFEEIGVANFLSLAISICEGIEDLHKCNIIHKNLNPFNIWINPFTKEVKFMDFAISSYLSKEKKKMVGPTRIEGNLEYISPEQTGRMNRVVDYRSDLYSLGVTLYEILTGNKPFYSFDQMELIHFHIAKSPIPPHLLRPGIPEIVSEIILKLMAKNGEDRYQSATGVKLDLKKCLREYNLTENISPFKLGIFDFSDKLQISEKLYGRQKEAATLLHYFEEISNGGICMILVEGYSGVGKSVLVQEIHKPITAKRGYFIEGKYNQFNTNVPYFAFISAFKEFIDFILGETPGNLAKWREDIQEVLGNSGKVLTDVIPNLELLIGVQQEVPYLPPSETLNRFNYLCRKFIKIIAKREHPLVMFIDDVQWADNPSLDLIKNLMTDSENSYFLLICAYRNNEPVVGKSFASLIRELSEKGVKQASINLSNLSYSDVLNLLSDTLLDYSVRVESLARLVFRKTQGNAFFVIQFIKSLYEELLLQFDAEECQWKWDVDKIEEKNITENVIQLMAEKIQKLPPAEQTVLAISACLGSNISTELLKLSSLQNESETEDSLQVVVDEGLIMIRGNNYRFSHDKIQQAVYSLLSEDDKRTTHLHIGNSMLRKLNRQEIEENIFGIVNQFMNYLHFLDLEEKERLVDLLITAGKKAKKSAAYQHSLDYLSKAIEVSKNEDWETKYEFLLNLYSEAAESAYLCGNYSLMENWVNLVLKKATKVLDMVNVYEIRIRAYTAESKLYLAIETALQVLKLLGIQFPDKPSKIDVIIAMLKIKAKLRGRNYNFILSLPPISNPLKEAAIRIMCIVGSATYFAYPGLFPLLVCKAFELVLVNGNSPYSGIVCAGYGIIVTGGAEDFKGGFQLGNVTQKLMDAYPMAQLRCRINVLINGFIVHWVSHNNKILSPLMDSHKFGMEIGDYEYVSYSALVYCYNKFFCGNYLQDLCEEMKQYCIKISQLNQKTPSIGISIFTQAVQNLIGDSEQPHILKGTTYNEEKDQLWETEIQSESLLFDLMLCKCFLCYTFEEYELAVKHSIDGERYIKSNIGNALIRIFYFNQALAILALKEGYSNKIYSKILNRNIKKFQAYSLSAPMNNLHKLKLIQAEIFRKKKQNIQASLLYEEAIAGAKENNYLNDEALACELAAKFHLKNNNNLLGEFYMVRAVEKYRKWGATAKVSQLEKKYSNYLKIENYSSSFSLPKSNIARFDKPLSSLQETLQWDLNSIMKASIAISGEIRMEKLLEKLIKIAIENVGAQRGFLILQNTGTLTIEAEGDVNSDQVILHHGLPMKDSGLVAEHIVQFVFVTKETLILEDASSDFRFLQDSFVLEKSLKSILCMPIINYGNTVGILYLENNLTTGAFTSARAELLKILSGQMAVSIENALNEIRKTADFKEREKLLKKVNAHQKMITKAVIKTQENERKRIAEDLHDSLGYLLSTLKINLVALSDSLPLEGQEKPLKNAMTLLEESFKELKSISNDLMPDVLFNFGLVKAVEDLCNKISSSGNLVIRFKSFNMEKKLKKDFEIEVFRIIQEIINNVIKHAEAKNLEIQFVSRADQIIITAEDDGIGFNYSQKIKSKNKGKGLINIVNRVKYLNGKIDYEMPNNSGTNIIIHLPYK